MAEQESTNEPTESDPESSDLDGLKTALLHATEAVAKTDDDTPPDVVIALLAEVYAIVNELAVATGHTPEHIETLRLKKLQRRGGFTQHIVWAGNRQEGSD